MIPFHRNLWLSLLTLSLVNALVIWILHRYPQNPTSLDFLGAISISLSTSFGITVRDANDQGTKTSARLSLYVTFICGSIFFYVYVAFLTSALAIPSEYKPFQSPAEILQTNYRWSVKFIHTSRVFTVLLSIVLNYFFPPKKIFA